MSDRESPVRRWWRRKTEARNRERAPAASGDTALPTQDDFLHVDFDALDFNSDYTRFVLPDTPPSVRQRALRKLWASNAVFTTSDGLLDYAQDYRDAAVNQGKPVQSAYRIGRGFMTDAEAEACATRSDAAKGPSDADNRLAAKRPPHAEPAAAGSQDRALNAPTGGPFNSDEFPHADAKGSSRKPKIPRS